MEGLPNEYELNAFFGDTSEVDSLVGLENHEWTSNINPNSGLWDGFSSGFTGQASIAETNTIPPTAEAIQSQQPIVFPDPFAQLGAQNVLTNNFSFGSIDVPPIDGLWPNLAEQAFAPDLWNAPFPFDSTISEPIPPMSDSLAPQSSQSPEEVTDEGVRKRRRRIPPYAKMLLDECFERHREDPYVPQDEITELSSQTGLSIRQVRTYFANAREVILKYSVMPIANSISRARKLPPVLSPRSPSQPQTSLPIDIRSSKDAQQDPMERFLSSSPEDEGIPEEAVRKAAGTFIQPRSTSRRRCISMSDTMSVSDTAFSSGSSSSAGSIDSANSRGPRRGRKRQREPTQKTLETVIRKRSDPLKKYQCTFCTSDFAQKYDWRRHEESVHFPQKEWVCMPDGPTHNSLCVFCGLQHPDEKHLESHNCIQCSKAPHSQRTFLRKDKLIQHIGQVHGCPHPKGIKDWCRPVQQSVTLICGLCGVIQQSWNARADHIASHFSDGVGMDMWLLNRPGGVLPHTQLTNLPIVQYLEQKFTPTPVPSGEVKCESCDLRFTQSSHAICHRRKVHNTYFENDRKAMYQVEGPSSSQPSIIDVGSLAGIEDHLAQETFGMKLFQHRQGGASGSGKTPARTHLDRRPIQASHSNHSIQGGLPFTPRVPIWPLSGEPTSRVGSGQSLVSNPHADWRKQLYGQGKNHMPVSALSPRASGNTQRARSNLNPSSEPAPTQPPAPHVPPNLPPVPLGPIDELDIPRKPFLPTQSSIKPSSSSSPLSQQVRTVVHQVRLNAKNVSVPAQGMLHSLEQMDDHAPWPSPYERQ